MVNTPIKYFLLPEFLKTFVGTDRFYSVIYDLIFPFYFWYDETSVSSKYLYFLNVKTAVTTQMHADNFIKFKKSSSD